MRNGGSADGRGITNGDPVGGGFVSADIGVDSAGADTADYVFAEGFPPRW
jgi:hypothetical protein